MYRTNLTFVYRTLCIISIIRTNRIHFLLSIYLIINLYMYRKNDTLEELRNNFHEISTIFRQEVQRVNNTFVGILPAYGQEGNIFSICCNTALVLLDFL